MANTDMSPAEVAAFLDEPRLATLGGVHEDGSPGVLPALFVRDDAAIVLAPLRPRTGRTRTMSEPEVTEFLQEYRYPGEPGSHPFVATATLRKDGRPFVVPFGYLFDGGDFYLTINNARSLHARLRRDPRVALGVFASGFPERAVIARGVASVVDDPDGRISRRIFERQMRVYPWLDFDSYLANWLAAGRTTYRLRGAEIVAWQAVEEGADAQLRDAASLEIEPSFVAVFNEEFPTRVALLEGAPEPVDELPAAIADRFGSRYGEAARRLALGGHELLRLAPQRVQSWDTNKEPSERVTRGVDPDGRHLERGSWSAGSTPEDATGS